MLTVWLMKKVQKFLWQSSLLDDNGTITFRALAIEGASVETKVLQLKRISYHFQKEERIKRETVS
jgi:hypothetical protein